MQYIIKFGIEHLVSLTHLSRNVRSNKRYKAQNVPQSELQYMLINWNNLNNGGLQSVRDAYSHSLESGTIAFSGPVVGKTSAADFATVRSPRLTELHYLHPQSTELI